MRLLVRLAACLAALGSSGCVNLVYGTDVDMAPFEERAASPVLLDGVYCAFDVIEGDADSPAWRLGEASGCTRVSWRSDDRAFLFEAVEPDEDWPGNKLGVSAVPIGEGVFIFQAGPAPDDEPVLSPRYQLQLAFVSPDAIAVIMALNDQPMAELARLHGDLAFGETGGRLFVQSGKRSAIAAFLRDAAALALSRDWRDEPEELTVFPLVRVDAILPGSPMNEAQITSILGIQKAADALGAKAPRGIEMPGESPKPPAWFRGKSEAPAVGEVPAPIGAE